jgi:uncharacterized lipoprotein YmbA
MTCRRALAPALLLTAGTLGLAGCAGVADQTKYYMLSPMPAERGKHVAAAVSSPGIGVGPVQVSRYLDRLPIVTRDANDNVRISADNRWAEPLESGIAQVLSDNLAAQLGSERISVFPWRGGVARALDYQVVVAVLRFDGSPGRNVTLDVRWRLLGKDGQELALKRSTLNEPISGEGYQPIVHGMNRALARLALEIAAEIQSRADTRAAGS